MFSRVLKTIVSVSNNLRNERSTKNASIIFPSLLLQKLFPSTVCCTKNYSFEDIKLPVNPLERKNKIDETAQKEIDKLINENPELEKFKKVIEIEISVRRQDGERVPSNLRPRDWLEILKLKSWSNRKKFLDYLFVIEKKIEKRKQEQLEKNLEFEELKKKRSIDVDHNIIEYGIGRNSLFRRILDTSMNHLYIWNCLKAIMFGNKIIFDCSYDKFMSPKEIKSCAKQIMEAYAMNRLHNYPFEIILCNVNLNGEFLDRLQRFIPTLLNDDFPMTITTKSYLEMFDKSKLVYMTSNASNVIEKYDYNSIYIIGAFVDKGPKQPISLAKAKKEGLRMARLPIDEYVQFGFGSSKDLTLNQVLAIMLDAQCSDWRTAMQHLPKRKLEESRIASLERKIQKDMNLLKGTGNFDKSDSLLYKSREANDFSHASRIKLREQWNK